MKQIFFPSLDRIATVFFGLAVFLAMPAMAETVPFYALAMHGESKEAAGFAHFSYANPTAPKGGVLRQGVTGSFDNLNPFTIKGRPVAGLNYLYDSLMARSQDEPFTLYGLIAESVEGPEDRASIVFHLNPRARWHDGHAITPDDVVFSWQILRDHGRLNHRTYYKKVAKAEKIGPRMVRFTFKRNEDGSVDREMPLIMGLMPVLPKHIWEKQDVQATTLTPPMGSGPYRIVAVDPGRSVTYERVKEYWAADLPVNRGLYNFDAIKFDYYRDDAVALEAFKAGQFDIRRETDPNKWATAYDVPAVRDGRIRMEKIPHHRVEAIRAFAFNIRRPLLRDPVLREAVSYAFDADWVNRALYHGMMTRTTSFFPNSELAATGVPLGRELEILQGWRGQLPERVFSAPPPVLEKDADGQEDMRSQLRKAAALLRDHGYRVREGALVTPKGEPVQFEILLNDPADEKVALEFRRGLERLGIGAQVRTVDSAQYQARLNDFDYDMVLVRWFNSLSPGNEQIFYWGSQAADQKGSRNYAGIKDPAIDALATAIPAAQSRAELVAATRALDRVLLWGFYAVPLFYLDADHVAVWAGMRHPAVAPLYGFVLESWWQQN